MASDKQELIQLHQLLAEIRVFTKEKIGLDTAIDSLDAYNDIGITSINIDEDVDVQKDAIMALADELTNTIEAAEQHKQTTKTTTPAETVETTLFDVTENGVKATTANVKPDEKQPTEEESSDVLVEKRDAVEVTETTLDDEWGTSNEDTGADETAIKESVEELDKSISKHDDEITQKQYAANKT